MKEDSYFKKRKSAFSYALEGIYFFVKNEAHAKLHLLAALLAIGFSWFLGLSTSEWLWILSAIFSVLISEMLNSALERLADALTKEFNAHIKNAKDLGAGAVLLASMYALLVAACVFGPKFYHLCF